MIDKEIFRESEFYHITGADLDENALAEELIRMGFNNAVKFQNPDFSNYGNPGSGVRNLSKRVDFADGHQLVIDCKTFEKDGDSYVMLDFTETVPRGVPLRWESENVRIIDTLNRKFNTALRPNIEVR